MLMSSPPTPRRTFDNEAITDTEGQSYTFGDVQMGPEGGLNACERSLYSRVISTFGVVEKGSGGTFSMSAVRSLQIHGNMLQAVFCATQTLPLALFRNLENQNAYMCNSQLLGNTFLCAPITNVAIYSEFRDHADRPFPKAVVVTMARLDLTARQPQQVTPETRASLNTQYSERQSRVRGDAVLRSLEDEDEETMAEIERLMRRVFPKSGGEGGDDEEEEDGSDDDDYKPKKVNSGKVAKRPKNHRAPQAPIHSSIADKWARTPAGGKRGATTTGSSLMYSREIQDTVLKIIAACATKLEGVSVTKPRVTETEMVISVSTRSRIVNWTLLLLIESLRKEHEVFYDIDCVVLFPSQTWNRVSGEEVQVNGIQIDITMATKVATTGSAASFSAPIRTLQIRNKDIPLLTPGGIHRLQPSRQYDDNDDEDDGGRRHPATSPRSLQDELRQ
jgi:hypothetical protein